MPAGHQSRQANTQLDSKLAGGSKASIVDRWRPGRRTHHPGLPLNVTSNSSVASGGASLIPVSFPKRGAARFSSIASISVGSNFPFPVWIALVNSRGDLQAQAAIVGG